MIEDLTIKAADYTPEVRLQSNGKLLFKGISTPNNIYTFYQPILDWIEQFKATKPSALKLIFHFEYINTSTSKMLLQIIQNCYKFKDLGTDVEIIWEYAIDDEDQLDLGHDLESSARCQFIFVGIEE